MTRRTAGTLVIVFVLGAVANVLVTAWCVYNASTHNEHEYSGAWSDGVATYHVALMTGYGKRIAYWHLPVASEPEQLEPGRIRPPRWASTGDSGVLARLTSDPPKMEAGGYLRKSTRFEVAFGWPCLSFRGGFFVFASQQPMTQHDFGPELPNVFKQEVNYQTAEPRTMPLMPMLPGLAANTAVYAGAWWLVVFAPGTIRRHRRRRRGACVRCGYDRRGIGADAACPECGAAASGQPAATPPACAGGSDQEAA